MVSNPSLKPLLPSVPNFNSKVTLLISLPQTYPLLPFPSLTCNIPTCTYVQFSTTEQLHQTAECSKRKYRPQWLVFSEFSQTQTLSEPRMAEQLCNISVILGSFHSPTPSPLPLNLYHFWLHPHAQLMYEFPRAAVINPLPTGGQGHLEQQKITLSQFWKIEVWNQGVSRALLLLETVGDSSLASSSF